MERNQKNEIDMVEHVYNPSSQENMAENSESESSLSYTASSIPALDT